MRNREPVSPSGHRGGDPALPHPEVRESPPVAARPGSAVIVGQNPLDSGCLAHDDPLAHGRGTGVVTDAIHRAATMPRIETRGKRG